MNSWKLVQRFSVLLGLLVLFPSCTSPTSPSSITIDRFPAVSTVRIQLAQGHALVEGSDEGLFTVEYDSSYPTTCHQPEITRNADTLEVRGAFEPVACSGRAEVKVQVPVGTAILFHGAQASLTVHNAAVSVDAYATSVQARNLEFTGDSRILAHDGDVQVSLRGPPQYNLDLANSGGGNVLLQAEEEDLRGHLAFSVREGNGRIKAPYSFEQETRYDCECEPGVVWWIRREFTLTAATPVLSLSTRDETAELRLK